MDNWPCLKPLTLTQNEQWQIIFKQNNQNKITTGFSFSVYGTRRCALLELIKKTFIILSEMNGLYSQFHRHTVHVHCAGAAVSQLPVAGECVCVCVVARPKCTALCARGPSDLQWQTSSTSIVSNGAAMSWSTLYQGNKRAHTKWTTSFTINVVLFTSHILIILQWSYSLEVWCKNIQYILQTAHFSSGGLKHTILWKQNEPTH